MVISGNIKKKKAIILSPERIKDINSIVLHHCERIEYTAMTAANTRISFESIEELLDYDNFEPRRISELEITGYKKYSRIITINIAEWSIFSPVNYGTTIRVDYQLPSVEAETLFLHAFDEWYNKCIASYWLIGKFSVRGVLFIPSAFICFLRFVFGGPSADIDYGNIALLCVLAIFTVVCFVIAKLINYVDAKLIGNLFPAIAFLWGEETERYKKWENLRSNLLWGVIIALLLGLLTNFLYDTLKGI